MDIEIRLITSAEYYKEAYSESLKRTKLKKWEPLLATGLIFLGAILYLLNTSENLKLIPLFFFLAGIYELFKFYFSRKKWLKERLKNGIADKEVVLVFQDEFIKHEGPFSKGDIKWKGIKKTVLTDKGLFLIPENGISIYIPRRLFKEATDIEQIIQKVNKIHQNSPG